MRPAPALVLWFLMLAAVLPTIAAVGVMTREELARRFPQPDMLQERMLKQGRARAAAGARQRLAVYPSHGNKSGLRASARLSLWFRWDDQDVWGCIVSKSPDQSINSNQWDWGILTGSGNYYLIRNGSNTAATSNTAFYQNGWHHWVAVISPTTGRNTSALYIDGKLHTSFAGVNATTATSNTATRYIQTHYLNTGQLADLRIYNRYLSAADARALYQPSSRWDLYWQPSRRTYLNLEGVTTATASTSDSVTLTDDGTQTLGNLAIASEWSRVETITSSNW